MAPKPAAKPKGPAEAEKPKGPAEAEKPKGPPEPGKTKGPGAEAPPTDKPAAEEKPKEKAEDEKATGKGCLACCSRYLWNLQDNNKIYWTMGHGQLKLLSICCLIVAYVKFSEVSLNPIITDCTLMEITFLSFFFFVYIIAFNRYCTCILWPASDIFNCVFSIVFLTGVLIIAMEEGKPYTDTYFVSLILVGLALFLTALDTCLQYKYFKRKYMKNNFLVVPKTAEKAVPKAKK